MSQPIKLYGHTGGPNPWKVAIIFEELGLPYTTEYLDLAQTKAQPYLSVNPNGRVPAIEDPNTGITLWESSAICEYLIETYDKDHKLSYTTSPERFYEKQWAAFQISGQGPYYGQAIWFMKYHHEKLPSAVERYVKEIERVIGVFELHFETTGQKYLVGDKCTWVDLMCTQWAFAVGAVDPEGKILGNGKYPKYQDWMKRLNERPAVVKAMADKAKVNAH